MGSGIIELRDVGPIESLRIPLPAGGGIVVLHGKNGSGKSWCLDAVSALAGGKGKIASRDGSAGAFVEGLGARLTVGRRSSRAGEIEVSHLEGEDPSLLVDPGLKSESAADAARIKALLRLSRAEVSVDAFAALVGGRERLEDLCRPASLDVHGQDVPAMAAAIKRDLEAAARKEEAARDNAFSRADGVRDTLDGLGAAGGMSQPSQAAAQRAHTRAVREHEALQTEQKNAATMLQQAGEARAALEAFGEDGVSEWVERSKDSAAEAQRVVKELEEQLKLAEAARDAAIETYERHRLAAARRAPLQRAVAAAVEVREVPEDEVEALSSAVAAAQAELEAWAVHERTSHLRQQATDLDDAGAAHSKEAALLRNAAAGTETMVLDAVRAVCGDAFELHEGRLYVRTDRGRELFSDLSHGECWRLAIDVAVTAVGSDGLLVVRQEAYESLDPDNRRDIAEHAKRLGVVILTAEADAGEIRAETFFGDTEATNGND